MRARLKKLALGLLVGAMLIAMALPAVSSEHDRPEDVPPDAPTSGVDSPQGEDEGAVGPDSHGTSGDFDDFVSIRNQSGTGLSRLNLNTTDSIVINSDTWRIANNADTKNLEISEGGTTNRFVMRQGGNLGLGTDNPLSPLHIDRSGGFQLRMAGSGADYRMDAFGTSLRIGDSSNTNQFRIFGADAPFNALTVGNGVGVGTASPQGGLHVSDIGGAPTDALVVGQGIGIGTDNPQSALDLHNIGPTGTTQYRITNSGHSWVNAVRANSDYAFNLADTAGPEFLIHGKNHSSGDVLDVEGAVRATAFNTSSSKAFKTNTRNVDTSDVLSKLNQLPVSSWQFKGCKDGEGRLEHDDGTKPPPCSGTGEGPRHLGPMAEDFHAVFGLGNGESIATVDADGVMMAAIQALTQQLEEKSQAISELEQKVADLESRMDALEAQAGSGSPKTPGRP